MGVRLHLLVGFPFSMVVCEGVGCNAKVLTATETDRDARET